MYLIEDVKFHNSQAEIDLYGTLTIPKKGKIKGGIVLVSGSGPQDRDETIFGHKPFWVIADALTSKGWIVLRYDERGVGKSTGNFQKATTFDFANDAVMGTEFFKKSTRT